MNLSVVNYIAGTAFTGALAAITFYLPWTVRRSYRQTFIALARAVEAREPHLLGHAEQTANYVVWMARLRGMGLLATRRMEYAALLHGIGKVSIPYELLNTPASLSRPADRFVLRDYVRVGAAIFDVIPILRPASNAIRFHHEYQDGSGYPFGRYGRSIPVEAQMLCIASEYVAMTNPRLYRDSLSKTPAQANRYLREQVGRRYSWAMVLLFLWAKASQNLQIAVTALIQRLQSQLSPPRLSRRLL
jgi:HD-GYP domain-containing protein (c-di-GMP phosphodiesterase class II)